MRSISHRYICFINQAKLSCKPDCRAVYMKLAIKTCYCGVRVNTGSSLWLLKLFTNIYNFSVPFGLKGKYSEGKKATNKTTAKERMVSNKNRKATICTGEILTL